MTEIVNPRTRTQGPGFTLLPSSTYTVTYCGNSPTTGTVANTVSQANGWSRTTTDYVVQNFRQRQAAGEIFNNPFQSTHVDEVGTIGGTWTQTRKASCSVPSDHKATTLPGGLYTRAAPLLLEIGMPDLRTLAGTQAASGVQSANVQGLVELAELKKTLAFISNPLTAMKQLLQDIARSKKFKKWQKWRKAKHLSTGLMDFMSTGWLQYRYAFMPLLYLTDDAIAAMTEPAAPLRKTSRGSSDWTASDSVTAVAGNPVVETQEVTTMHQITYSCRAGVLYEHRLDLNANIGVRLSDIPEAAWELVPFSFVADWFVNVGDFLGAIRPKLGVNVLSSWTTMRVVDVCQRHVVASGGSGDANYSYTSSRTAFSRIIRRTTTRTPGISVGLAAQWTTIDNFKSIHLKRSLDSLSLIYKLLRK